LSDGLVVVDKPGGWTSHQVVGRLRRILGTRKIGHAGTLDPMATGVLLAGVGRATRLLGHLSLTDKCYTATVRLGQQTTTDDADGEVVAAPGAAGVELAAVRDAVAAYRGVITQVPSAVSAIKVDGQRAYARVRRGEDVVLAGREVTVARFEVTAGRCAEAAGVSVLDVDVEVDCSSGTYVRALARDLGRDLGTGGHLTALRRTRVGGFRLTEPHLDPEGLTAESAVVPMLTMAEVARRTFSVVEVDAAAAGSVRHGRPLDQAVAAVAGGVFAVLHDDELLALYRSEAGRAVPVAVFAAQGTV
jgi:tRNA pseudouridine55 synthase